MSKAGLKVAIAVSSQLPQFNSLEEAKNYYFSYRDERLALLKKVSQNSKMFSMDFKPESLKILEKWYFQLYENDSFSKLGITREVFEECMAMYFCELAIRLIPNFTWAIEESPFVKRRYEFGIQKPLFSYMLSRFTDLHKQPDNKRHQYIYRQYKRLEF
ncbi:MAG TPA: hypothetical protein VLG12_03650 [Candidatus Saccharimonadales bacterium]|nr:hypothetical protein [Candidatus Saccharimonadales bacterium]